MVTAGQLTLLILSISLLGAATLVAWARLVGAWPGQRLLLRGLMAGGLAAAAGGLVWHAAMRGDWMPLGDNFQTLIWLGLLLGIFLVYLQVVRPLPGIESFILPVIVAMLVGAAVFGKTRPHDYVAGQTWEWVHHAAAYTSAVAFAIAFAVSARYLVVNRRLRRKQPVSGPPLGSLERLEHLTLSSVTLGFALLTVGLVMGLVIIIDQGWTRAVRGGTLAEPKIWLGILVWLVYAVVLHAPINPRFRGRRAAILSVLGFFLMLGVLVAVQFMGEV